jgi:hypothetical protein
VALRHSASRLVFLLCYSLCSLIGGGSEVKDLQLRLEGRTFDTEQWRYELLV